MTTRCSRCAAARRFASVVKSAKIDERIVRRMSAARADYDVELILLDLTMPGISGFPE